MGVIRNCCPNCGGQIEVSKLYQYSLNHTVLKNGKLSKKSFKRDDGPLEVTIAGCINEDCNCTWDEGDFRIDENSCFVDMKYVKEELFINNHLV